MRAFQHLKLINAQFAIIECLIDVSDTLDILTRVLFQSVAERGTHHIARATRQIIALMVIRHLANRVS